MHHSPPEMKEPLSDRVSVILPYHNRVDVLLAAIESVLVQSYRALTLILVDDASDDGSDELAHSLDDERIVNIRTRGRRGASAARNLGLNRADSPLVAFQDSDDLWASNKLESQVRALRSAQLVDPAIAVMGCGWKYSGQSDTRSFEFGPHDRRDVLYGRVRGLGTPMLLIDRNLCGWALFDEEMAARQDQDFVLNCLSSGGKVAVLPGSHVIVTRGRTDHVARPENTASAHLRFLDKYCAELSTERQLRSWHHFRACREFCLTRSPREIIPHVKGACQHEALKRLIHLSAGFIGGGRGLAVSQRMLPLWDPRQT